MPTRRKKSSPSSKKNVKKAGFQSKLRRPGKWRRKRLVAIASEKDHKMNFIRPSFLLLCFSLVVSCCAGPRPSSAQQGDENTILISNRYFSHQNLLDLAKLQNGKTALRLEFQRCTFQGQVSLSALPNAYQNFPVGIFFVTQLS